MSCDLRTVLRAGQASFCCIEGDANLYGLGIRIGTYLIWAASLVAYNIARSEASTLRLLSGCYQLATLLALLIASASERSLFAAEACILLALCIGGLCTSTDLPSSATYTAFKSYATLDTSDLGNLMRIVVLITSAGYGLWYALSGFDNVCRSLCANSSFFFGEVSLYGWYRELLKALFILYAIGIAALGGFTIWSALSYRRGSGTVRVRTTIKSRDELDREGGGIITLSIGAVVMVILIIAIELIIYWNKLENVHSCGSVAQLIPLLVAAVIFCKTFMAVCCNQKTRSVQLKGR